MREKHAGLLKRAMSARTTTTLEDVENGLRAEVEVSADSLARAIHIFEGDARLSSTVVHQPGATEPSFHPADVPFISGASGTISGDVATWSFPSDGAPAAIESFRRGARELLDRQPELGEKSEELASAVKGARGADAVHALLASFLGDLDEEVGETIRRLGRELAAAGEEAGPRIDSVVDEILAFYQARGWRVVDADTGGVTRRHRMEKGERRLVLTVMAGFGAPTVTLMGRRS